MLCVILLYLYGVVACDFVAQPVRKINKKIGKGHFMQQLNFSSRVEFLQSALNAVSQLVSQHAFPSIESFVPVDDAECCLKHLAVVASDWSYEYAEIDERLKIITEFNNQTKVYLGELD